MKEGKKRYHRAKERPPTEDAENAELQRTEIDAAGIKIHGKRGFTEDAETMPQGSPSSPPLSVSSASSVGRLPSVDRLPAPVPKTKRGSSRRLDPLGNSRDPAVVH
jgi:hypothetical protein